MLHDPDAFAAITRKMREAGVAAATELPSVEELLLRIDQALDLAKGQKGPTAKPPV